MPNIVLGGPTRYRGLSGIGWTWEKASIWAHVSGCRPYIRGSLGLALLQAFTDDSAAQSGDRRLFLAGYLHRADAWSNFSNDWYKALTARPSIGYFKASEAYNLSGEFYHKKGWTEATRNAKVQLLASVIKHYRPLSFEFSINRQIFEDELKPVSPYGLGAPHFAMCFAVVAGIANYAAQEGITTPIEFIFDEQQGVDADIDEFFSYMKEKLPLESRRLIAELLCFKNDKDNRYLPLQAADLLAWHRRREHEIGDTLPVSRDLLNDAGHLVQEIPDTMLRSWAEHHRQLPNVEMMRTKGQWRKLKTEIKRLKASGIDPSKLK